MSRTIRRTNLSGHGLGFVPDPDPQDHLYPMELAMEVAPVVLPVEFMYKTGPILNQGKAPKCVGYSTRQFLTTGLIENTGPNPSADTIYCEARKRDPWDGDCSTGELTGTSVRAAMKYLQEQGFISTYLWAFHAETVRQWILQGKGPCVIGSPWYDSMYRTVAGRCVVNTNTALRGGHAYLLSGYNDKKKLFRITNSWGKSWGQQGHAWIRYADLDTLFANHAECCTATELLYTPQTTIIETLEPSEDYVNNVEE